MKSAARRAYSQCMSRCQLTRVAPSSADHPHAAEPYPPDEGKGNRPCTVVVSVVRLESKVERHCVLREGKYAATWTRQDGSVYGGGLTGGFPRGGRPSLPCPFRRRPWRLQRAASSGGRRAGENGMRACVRGGETVSR